MERTTRRRGGRESAEASISAPGGASPSNGDGGDDGTGEREEGAAADDGDGTWVRVEDSAAGRTIYWNTETGAMRNAPDEDE